jgi:aldehyde dehydrogenase (NAD+)
LLVHESVHRRFVQELVASVAKLRVGNGITPEVDVGPLVSAAQKERVLGYLQVAAQEGGRTLCGGSELTAGDLAHGHFVAPTVLADVQPSHRAYQEEIFGPVLCVTPFASLSEALHLANDSDLGLSAAVFTSDLDAALDFIDQIEAGVVHVNRPSSGADPHVPFGGMKGSSSFSREQGTAALEFYSQTQTVYVARAYPRR